MFQCMRRFGKTWSNKYSSCDSFILPCPRVSTTCRSTSRHLVRCFSIGNVASSNEEYFNHLKESRISNFVRINQKKRVKTSNFSGELDKTLQENSDDLLHDSQCSAGDAVFDFHSDSPGRRQYLDIKRQHKDYLLLYRMGDFYEMFDDDAIRASAALDIQLTHRVIRKKQIAMAGIPHHAIDTYIERLLKKNICIAICDQTPMKKGDGSSSKLLKREVTRIITPGTMTDERLLSPRENNFLCALQVDGNISTLCWVDVSTGVVSIATVDTSAIATQLARIHPREILVNGICDKDILVMIRAKYFVTQRQEESIDFIPYFYSDMPFDQSNFSTLECKVTNNLLGYLKYSQKDAKLRLQAPQKTLCNNFMYIDCATRSSLNLTTSDTTKEHSDSLLASIDQTVTSSGARLLASRLQSPSTEIHIINSRLDFIDVFYFHPIVAQELRILLKQIADIERCLQRISMGRGSPRDLLALADSIAQLQPIHDLLSPYCEKYPILRIWCASLQSGLNSQVKELVVHLHKAISDKCPYSVTDGGFIRDGFSIELDILRGTRTSKRKDKDTLLKKYRDETGISSLEIRENRLLGHYIEIPTKFNSLIEGNKKFVLRQDLCDRRRYKTEELMILESNLGQTQSEVIAKELQMFDDLCEKVMGVHGILLKIGRDLADIDVAVSLAVLASEQGFVRPTITTGFDLDIRGGRHPVIESIQMTRGRQFVKNDCVLNDFSKYMILTGANMGGKSTFLRQNALITIMAHLGSYVPADSATIGLVDSVFSRVGASDDLSQDKSTFMVEMLETSAILSHAAERSLVIMDEIGRGTATFDGLAIAWATIDHIYRKNKCRSLFATHYHELATMVQTIPAIQCTTMAIQEAANGEFVFLHKVFPGIAKASYGLQVAAMAGFPECALVEARKLQQSMETRPITSGNKVTNNSAEMKKESTFINTKYEAQSSVLDYIKSINVETISPLQAIMILANVQNDLKSAS